MQTIAEKDALEDATVAAADALLDYYSEDEQKALTLMVAVLRHEGWGGPLGGKLLSGTMEYTAGKLAAAKKAAEKITNPWSAFRDGPEELKEAGTVFRSLLRQHSPATLGKPKATQLDLEGDPEPPNWLLPEFLVRGKTHMLSGPTGAFKSGLCGSMMAASLTGQPFLGRTVAPLRWMVLDGENSQEDITAHWKALGIRPDHLPNVYLVTREANVRLGEDDWNEWLTEEVQAFQPDVLVLDTVIRVCAGINSLDGDAVAALYSETLVPLVDRHNLALLFMAHHRKSGGRAGTDEAVNGTGQWANQAEQTLTIANTGPLTFMPGPDGARATRRPFVIRHPKGRTLVSNEPEHVEVKGRLDVRGALVSLSVTKRGEEDVTTVERLLGALETPLGTGALADAVGLNRTGRAFRNALAEAIEGGLITRDEDGLYTRL